jgi:hypothetical protein
MRQHGTEATMKRDAARTAEAFLAAMQQAAREMAGAMDLPDYKPIRGFAPRPKEA